jgi:hypothetical protein
VPQGVEARVQDEVDKAVHQLEEEAAIVGATLVAGAALAFFTAGISEAAAAGVSASIVAAAETIGVTVSATIADIAATTLTGVAFGAVESLAVDAAVAQPVRMSFGDGGFSGTELLSAAETGGLAGGAQNAARLAGAADGLSPVAASILTKLPTVLDSLPGRAVLGGGLAAGGDALLNDGQVNPLDVVTGAVGGAAGKGLPRSQRDELVPQIKGRPQNVSEAQFQALSATLTEKFAGIDGDILIQGSRAGYFAHAPRGGGPASDIDIMVRVDPQEFDRILAESYSKTPNPGSSRERSLQYSQQQRIIKAGEVKLYDWAGQLSLSKWRDQVLVPTVNRPIDLSIVERGSPFDLGSAAARRSSPRKYRLTCEYELPSAARPCV